jgi:rRNA maturation RNase YbeY
MIKYDSIYEGFSLDAPQLFSEWLKQVIKKENGVLGNIQYVFCSDEYLLDVNLKYLHHDYFTDIITFPFSEDDKIISGEIYISIDRVRENAKKNNVRFVQELARVIVHGVLHLLGYEDYSSEQKKEMRQKEDYYLNLLGGQENDF